MAFAVAYAFHDQLIEFLQWPLPDRYKDTGLITLSPTEPFFTTLKVCFWAAILAALPVWLYQLYAFVIPAVAGPAAAPDAGDRGRRVGPLRRGRGVRFFVVLPVALQLLLGFGGDTFDTQVRAGEYFGFVTTLMLGAGLMFEVPVAMLALARIGVASAASTSQQWRVAIVVIAVLAAILPGGDPFSMLLLMVPQVALYALGIALAAALGQPADLGPTSLGRR